MVEQMIGNHFDEAYSWGVINNAIANRGIVSRELTAMTLDTPYIYEIPRIPLGSVVHTFDRDVRIAMRVSQPNLIVFESVLSMEECDEIIRRSVDKLERSSAIDPFSGEALVVDDRTSEGTYFHLNADPFIERLDRRISELMHWPVDRGEGLQVLHYHVGGEYKPHFDFFPREYSGSHIPLRQGGQRVATMVIYLNDVEAGGATIFPELNIEVLPRKGSAVYFQYTNSQGQNDKQTLHGGAPVVKGEKWILTKWMRQHKMNSDEMTLDTAELQS